jgi:hypothetical protein
MSCTFIAELTYTVPGSQVDPPAVCFHPLRTDLEPVDVEPAQDLQERGEVRHVLFQECLHLQFLVLKKLKKLYEKCDAAPAPTLI